MQKPHQLWVILLLALTMPLTAQPIPENPVILHVHMGVDLPDPRMMDAFVTDFAADDPVVQQVIWQTSLENGFDCGTTTLNGPLPGVDLLDLTPHLTADPAFDEADYLPGIFTQVTTIAGRITGLPLVFVPEALWIDTADFDDAGVPLPTDGWTTDTFLAALNTLPNRQLIRQYGNTFSNRYMLLLAGAFGAHLLDHRTQPPTPNLTTPETLAAVQMLRGLVWQGTLQHEQLFIADSTPTIVNFPRPAPIQLDRVGLDSRRMAPISFVGSTTVGRRPVPYPTNPNGPAVVSYNPISGTIHAATPHPEACYRLLRALVDRPDMFFSPPAKIALLDDPAFLDSEIGVLADYVAAFNTKLVNSPQPPIVLPLNYGDAFWPNMWFNRALDRIISGMDPVPELERAQRLTAVYLVCAEDVLNDPDREIVPPADFTTDCVERYDPDGYAALFGDLE